MVELGCGCGLVGLTAAAAGSEVVLTDLVLAMAQRNLDVNFAPAAAAAAAADSLPSAPERSRNDEVRSRVRLQQLQWDSSTNLAAVQAGRPDFDVILGTDLLYSQETWTQLAQVRTH